jgi:hypothetical protein
MSNEVTVTGSLRVVSGSTQYQSQPSSFKGNIVGHPGTGSVGGLGPTPGYFMAVSSGTGTKPDLSQLTTPGYYRVQNLSDNLTVDIGLVVSGTFYGLQELLPGETYNGRFSGILDPAKLSFKGRSASVACKLEAFQA